ncbi:MAG: hypothetical protein LBI30_00765 [Holosporales bacterium]|jgi:sugar O-acyltransferase (sialic acid O-acetyltransferase NeuD family)|nr:hypothetical protein [Holosporales bacterium]
MRDLVLIGGGGHCRSCIDVIELENKFRILGVLDDNLRVGVPIGRYSVIGNDSDAEKIAEKQGGGGICFLVTVGFLKTLETRKNIFERFKNKVNMATVISPLAYVSKYASVGRGTIVLHHAMINFGAKVGENCIINSKALIEHDAIVEDHCHVSTAVVINGSVKIGHSSFVGSNSTVVQCMEIANSSFIKANRIVKNGQKIC